MKFKLILLLTIASIGFQHNALAIPKPKLPVYVGMDGKVLQRCSIAKVKALKIFKVGYASLYLEDCSAIDNNIALLPKQVSFEYYREIPGDAFAKAATNFLKKNLSAEEFSELEPTIQAFNSKYKDTVAGDRYDLSYIPNKGVSLYLNGKLLSMAENNDFAQAYFKIWFGEKPFSKRLKTNLLKWDRQVAKFTPETSENSSSTLASFKAIPHYLYYLE